MQTRSLTYSFTRTVVGFTCTTSAGSNGCILTSRRAHGNLGFPHIAYPGSEGEGTRASPWQSGRLYACALLSEGHSHQDTTLAHHPPPRERLEPLNITPLVARGLLYNNTSARLLQLCSAATERHSAGILLTPLLRKRWLYRIWRHCLSQTRSSKPRPSPKASYVSTTTVMVCWMPHRLQPMS